jgi:hypothetical protein
MDSTHFIMFGFRLDVDSPYPIPTQSSNVRPDVLAYPQKFPKYRFMETILHT